VRWLIEELLNTAPGHPAPVARFHIRDCFRYEDDRPGRNNVASGRRRSRGRPARSEVRKTLGYIEDPDGNEMR
jgi:hypothetical protein